jgi:hypothetical protein
MPILLVAAIYLFNCVELLLLTEMDASTLLSLLTFSDAIPQLQTLFSVISCEDCSSRPTPIRARFYGVPDPTYALADQ